MVIIYVYIICILFNDSLHLLLTMTSIYSQNGQSLEVQLSLLRNSVPSNKVRMVHCIFEGLHVTIVFLKIDFVLANRPDTDEIPHNAAFHLGLHCPPKYPFRGIRTVQKGLSHLS